MIPRLLEAELKRQLTEFPIVTVLGPRQAGKTTLAKMAVPDFDYVTLEDPEQRRFATEDPKAFIRRHNRYVIFDEIQRVPELLSHLQVEVDQHNDNGIFVLTGSHQLQLREAVAQSLAGRTGMLHLLPLSIAEMKQAQISFDTFSNYIFNGFYPRIHAESQRPHIAYQAYYQTYVERDVRQLIQLKDAVLFEKFMKLLAGRVGQIFNAASIANDVGVSPNTISEWVSILEASFLIFRLPPYFENFGKRVIKSPKIFFTDVGLLARLLGIENAEQVSRDPLVGSLFENLIVIEALKARYNRGLNSNLYFFRDSNGLELDLVFTAGRKLSGVEIKSSSTYHPSLKRSLVRFERGVTKLERRFLIYSGESQDPVDGVELVNFRSVKDVMG